MITGAHTMIYSTDAEADRAFFRDVLELSNVDLGGGWLVFSLPPTELGFHPIEAEGKHELYLMVDDIKQFAAKMADKKVPCSGVTEEPWGHLVAITLPGGSELGVYQPLYERPSS